MSKRAAIIAGALLGALVLLWWFLRRNDQEPTIEDPDLRYDVEELKKLPNYRPAADSKIRFSTHEDFVKTLKLKNVKSGEKTSLELDGVFVSIGFTPNTDYINGVVPLDERGVVIVNEDMATGVPGIFAAGDICRKSMWQVAIAVGDGAVAAISAERYIGG